MELKRKYWTQADYEKLAAAQTYQDLFLTAKGVLERMRQPVGQVCGPITTGGTLMRENLERLEAMIVGLQEHGLELFDQVPFQIKINEIRKPDEGEEKLLNEFYLPLFENHLVQTLYFLPDWETSAGARWEHEAGKRLGMHMVYLQ